MLINIVAFLYLRLSKGVVGMGLSHDFAKKRNSSCYKAFDVYDFSC